MALRIVCSFRIRATIATLGIYIPMVRDDIVAMKRDRLKDALDRGDQDVAAGRVIELETEEQIDVLFASL